MIFLILTWASILGDRLLFSHSLLISEVMIWLLQKNICSKIDFPTRGDSILNYELFNITGILLQTIVCSGVSTTAFISLTPALIRDLLLEVVLFVTMQQKQQMTLPDC